MNRPPVHVHFELTRGLRLERLFCDILRPGKNSAAEQNCDQKVVRPIHNCLEIHGDYSQKRSEVASFFRFQSSVEIALTNGMKQTWMSRAGLSFSMVALILTGCIPSLQPLYTEKDLLFEAGLVG